MQFDLTEEQKLLTGSLRSLIADADKAKAPLARFDEGAYADPLLWPRLRDLGVCGLLARPEHGGLGDELLTLAVVAETLSYGAVGSPVIQQALAAWLLAETDAEASLVSDVISGTRLAVFALCESGECWQPPQWRLSGPRITGRKTHVIGGSEADIFIVALGGGEFAVAERGAPGLSVAEQSSLDRTRPLASVTFDEAPVRPLHGASDLAARLTDALLVYASADAFGAALRAVDLAVDYAKTRRQFGRLIGSFQALKHQLANMTLDVEPCRFLVWYAAHAWDKLPAEASHHAALAKAHVTDVAMRTSRLAVEAHGGIGFTWEYSLHLWLKRTLFDHGFMGSVAIHRARAAALAGW